MNRDNRFMAAALAANEPRCDLIALRVEPQSIASQPVAEPEPRPCVFLQTGRLLEGRGAFFPADSRVGRES